MVIKTMKNITRNHEIEFAFTSLWTGFLNSKTQDRWGIRIWD